MLRNIILGLGVFAALFAVLIFSGRVPIGNKGADKPQGEVIVWGTIPQSAMSPILQSYNPQAQTYRVSYVEVRPDVFTSRLVEALANGVGPDVIIAPHTTILSQASRIYTFPVASISEKKYKDTYVDGASVFLTPEGPIAFPITIDPLVLFYNRRIFSQRGIITPPQYWDEITKLVPALTQVNDRGQVTQSGIALGAATTPYAKEILMSVVYQLGQIPTLKQNAPNGTPYITMLADTPVTQGTDAVHPLSTVLRFFTQFADPAKNTYTWNDTMGDPTDYFIAEKLAMYIGYASELPALRARNPKADFDVSYLPQTRGYNTFGTDGRILGIATLKSSKNLLGALTVESQFGGTGVAPAIASSIGAVPALRSYAATPGISDVLARSMLVAQAWYDSFPTQSTANVATMIADVLNGKAGPSDAADTFVARMQGLYTPR